MTDEAPPAQSRKRSPSPDPDAAASPLPKKRAAGGGIAPSGLGTTGFGIDALSQAEAAVNPGPHKPVDDRFVTPLSSPSKKEPAPTGSSVFGGGRFANISLSADTPAKGESFSSLLAKASADDDGKGNLEKANDDTEKVDSAAPASSAAASTSLKIKEVILTGEENEICEFQSRCKLFHLDETSGSWKERGIGQLKLLKNSSPGSPDTPAYRLVMRTEHVLRLILNIKVTGVSELVQDRYVRLVGREEAGNTPLLIKFASGALASKLQSTIALNKPAITEAAGKKEEDATRPPRASSPVKKSTPKEEEKRASPTKKNDEKD